MDAKPGKNSQLIMIVVALVAAAVGFFVGRSTAPASTSTDADAVQSVSAQQEPTEQTTDLLEDEDDSYVVTEEARILANRSELDNIKLVDGPIYVIGHKSPDADTVCSSIAYASLLREIGYDAQPAVVGDINNETAYILKEADISVPEKLDDASGLNIILVDHSEYEHSAKGLENANVITIVDHHGDGAVTTSNQMIYDARPLGSTNTIVWMRYLDYGVSFDKQMAKVMLGGILSDTMGLKANVTDADEEATNDLAAEAGITDVGAYYTSIYKASISHGDQTDEQIFNADIKTYDAGGKRYAIGVVNVYDEDEAKDIAKRMKELMPGQLKGLDLEYAFAQISAYHDDVSFTYLVPANKASKKVLEAAYGDTATFDGASYIIQPGISRKAKLVPDIDAVLTAQTGE